MEDNGARAATWTCEVGPADRATLPDGADFPMRQAVRRAFHELTGADPERLSSGWGRLPDVTELDRLRRIEAAAQNVAEDSATWWVQPPIGSGSSMARLPMESVHFTQSMAALRAALAPEGSALSPDRPTPP